MRVWRSPASADMRRVCRKGGVHSGGKRSGRLPYPSCHGLTKSPNEPFGSGTLLAHEARSRDEPARCSGRVAIDQANQWHSHRGSSASRGNSRQKSTETRRSQENLVFAASIQMRPLSRVVRSSGRRRPRSGAVPRSELRHLFCPRTESLVQGRENHR